MQFGLELNVVLAVLGVPAMDVSSLNLCGRPRRELLMRLGYCGGLPYDSGP